MTMIPQYNTLLFTDVWDNDISFLNDVKTNPLNKLCDEDIKKIFYLLYAKYANSPIANFDVNQFKFKVYSIMYQYGPAWSKRMEIQERLRGLSEDELVVGNKHIQNHAWNPSTQPTTAQLEEVPEINDQSTNTVKRGLLDAYAYLWDLLATDVTTEFINRFKICFKQFVMPEHPTLYIDDDED